MELMVVDSIEAYERTQLRVRQLLAEVRSESEAVDLAGALVAGQGQETNVEHLRANVYADAGVRLKSIALIEEGIRIWAAMEPQNSAAVSYNLASAHLYGWQLAVEQMDLGEAWLKKRIHLHEARRLFNSVARDQRAENELRLKALTDCGNSFDIVGRHLDALNCYDEALKIDPLFGMASGNRGIALLKVAPLMGEHEPCVLLRAADDLDISIADRERVSRCGGQSAIDTFERSRKSLLVSTDACLNAHQPHRLVGDSHLDWCLRHGLYLHASPDCINGRTKILNQSQGEMRRRMG